MGRKLSPAKLLEKALAENNMELVKEAQALLKQKPKVKKVKKEKVAKVDSKTPKFNSDVEYLEYLRNLEIKHKQSIIDNLAGPIGTNIPQVTVNDKVCSDDRKLDEVLGKSKRRKPPSRPSVTYVTKKCPKCGDPTQVLSSDIGLYNWDINRVDSDKTLFTCGKC